MKLTLAGIIALLAVVCMNSCDTYEEDELNNGLSIIGNNNIQENYNVLPGSPVLINLAEQIKSTSPFSFKLTTKPSKGTIDLLEKGILRYTPNANVASGKDIIGYEIHQSSTNRTIKDVFNITITTDSSTLLCYTAIADHYKVLLNRELNLDVLQNDLLCDSLDSVLQNANLLIIQEPQHGTAVATQHGTISYKPHDNYSGDDQFIYQLCIQKDSAICLIAQVNLRVGSDSCRLIAHDDYLTAHTGKSDTLLINILSNDTLCFSRNDMAVTLSPPSDSLQLNADKDVILTYDNTKNSRYKFAYTLCAPNGVCKQANVIVEIKKDTTTASDTCNLLLRNDHFIFNISDSISVDSTDSFALNILLNDQVCHPARTTLKVSKKPGKGSTNILNEMIYYKPSNPGYLGKDTLRYQICYPTDTSCADAKVLIEFK